MQAEDNEHTRILAMIEAGQLSVEQGLRLLEAMQAGPSGEETPEEPTDPAWQAADSPAPQEAVAEEPPPVDPQPESAPPLPDLGRWRRYWLIPFLIGCAVMMLGATWMYNAYAASGAGVWFACAWLPFLLGVAILALGWGSRTLPWLHLRVDQPPGEWPPRIAFSFPLPLDLGAWFLRAFGDRLGKRLAGFNLGKLTPEQVSQMLQTFKKTVTPETPVYIEVDEGENEEKVLIYIG
jgi:hypothetical protein